MTDLLEVLIKPNMGPVRYESFQKLNVVILLVYFSLKSLFVWFFFFGQEIKFKDDCHGK